MAANSYTAVAERPAFVAAVGGDLAEIALVADKTALVAAGTVASLVSDVETRTALASDSEMIEIGAEAEHFDLAVEEEEQLPPAWQYVHSLGQEGCTFYI